MQRTSGRLAACLLSVSQAAPPAFSVGSDVCGVRLSRARAPCPSLFLCSKRACIAGARQDGEVFLSPRSLAKPRHACLPRSPVGSFIPGPHVPRPVTSIFPRRDRPGRGAARHLRPLGPQRLPLSRASDRGDAFLLDTFRPGRGLLVSGPPATPRPCPPSTSARVRNDGQPRGRPPLIPRRQTGRAFTILRNMDHGQIEIGSLLVA